MNTGRGILSHLTTRRGISRIIIVAVAMVIALVLSKRAPSDQTVHVDLGPNAPRVLEVRLRYSEPPSSSAAATVSNGATGASTDPLREVSYQYADGAAPRIVTHEPRLANGTYLIEVEVRTKSAVLHKRKNIVLSSGSVTLDTRDLFEP